MKFGRMQFLGIGLVGLLQSDCHNCPEYPCDAGFFLNGWCATSKTCRVNGQLVTKCEADGTTPDCRLWKLAAGTALEIPLEEVWPLLGKRNDLVIPIGIIGGPGDEGSIKLLFDGVPENDGMCVRTARTVSCPNLPESLQRLKLLFDKSPTSGVSALVYLDMHDTECEDTHEVCPL